MPIGPRRKSLNITRAVVLLGLLAMSVAAGWTLRGRHDASRAGSAPPTGPDTARVMRGRMEQTVKARGIVKPAPNALVRVGFPMPKDVARRIQTMKVVEGDLVKRGEVLAELDAADLEATLEQFKADALVAEKRLEAARTLEPVEVHLAETMRDQAQAQAELAHLNLQRAARLRTSSAVAQQEYETISNDRQVTRAKLANAEASLKQVKARFKTDIATLQAQVKQAKAAVRSALVQVEWSTIRSPIDGVVFAAHQRQGELTSNNPAAPVLTLLDPRQLQVHLYVDEADFGKVRLDQDVSLRVEAHAGETVKGKVVRLLPQPILQENVVYYLAAVEVEETRRPLLAAEMTTLATALHN